MGIEQELFGIKNRPEGQEFKVIERADGSIAVLAGDKVLVDSGVTPVTAVPSGPGVASDPAIELAAGEIQMGPLLMTPANTLAVIGDSITDSWKAKGATSDDRYGAGYLTWALALSGERLRVISDNSVGGATVTDASVGTVNPIYRQIDTAVKSGARHLLVMGGHNDFNLYAQSVADVKAAWLTIIGKALKASMQVWLVIEPCADVVDANQGKMLHVNDWLRQLAGSRFARSGLRVIDGASVFNDPVSATGAYKTGYSYDGTHPRSAGAYFIGKEIARVWKLFIPETQVLLSSNVDCVASFADSTNILTNGLFVNGAAPGTGFTRSVTAGGAVTSETLVARADGFGSDLQEVVTFAAANDSVRVETADLKAYVADGDELVASCEITVSNITNLRCVRFQLSATGATSSFTAASFQLDATRDTVSLQEGFTATLMTNPVKINLATLGALTSLKAQVGIFGNGAGGATVKIGRWSVRKVVATA